jgi:hypothetical protein
MTPDRVFGYTAISWNKKKPEIRAFVALMGTLRNQLLPAPKKFYVELSSSAWSHVVLLTIEGPFAETKEQLS